MGKKDICKQQRVGILCQWKDLENSFLKHSQQQKQKRHNKQVSRRLEEALHT